VVREEPDACGGDCGGKPDAAQASMKILIVTNMLAGTNPAQPAQGVFVSEQLDALRRLPGLRIEVIVVEGFRSRLAYPRSLVTILWRVWKGGHDIVHYHFGLTAWSAPIVRILSRAKVVVTFHGSDVFGRAVLRWSTCFAARFADACIAVSAQIQIHIAPFARYCEVIPCGVDSALFFPAVGEPDPTSVKTVVFPSCASRKEKDHPLFVATLEHLRGMVPHEVVERQIDGLNRDEVRHLLQRADALLMTSRREGSPQAVKEAMACGLPVVSVDVGDVAQLLEGVEHCRVVMHRDPALLALALRDVLAAGGRSNGPEHLARSGYFAGEIAQRVQDLYQRLLKRS
jgi:glycosyltransferase involved in cell wall biosynthesis